MDRPSGRASRLSPRAALALLLPLGAGCVPFSLVDDDRPPVEVLAIATRFLGETSGEMDVRLAFPNRREETIFCTGVSWELFVEGHHFASGMESFSIDIAPREERVLYLTLPLAYRRMPLRKGPIRMAVGLRGRVTARVGASEEEQGFPFARRMEILSEGAPVFPSAGQIEE